MNGPQARQSRFGLTTWRLAVILALAQLATLAVGLSIMHSLTQRTLANEARTAAQVARDDLVDVHRTGGDAALVSAIDERAGSPDNRDFVAFLRGRDGSRLAGNLDAWPDPAPRQGVWTVRELGRSGSDRKDAIGFVIQPLARGESLLTGVVMDGEAQVTRASEQSFVYAMLAGLLLAVLASWAILALLERRIDSFSGAARDIARGRLNTRIGLTRAGDAFDRLGLSINAMLERIEALVAELRAVTDSMAHDLRSPVARLRSALERSLGATADPPARLALADALDEADGLQRLLDTALEISRTEAGIGRNQFEPLDLAAMLRDLAEVYGPLAEEEGFQIEVRTEGNLVIDAHRELLFRAVSNLVDNALKYATGGSRIVLSGGPAANGRVQLEVADDGPGIAPEDREAAVRRFGRLDPARTRSGAGLGMALVSTIAALHGGAMTLDSNPPHGLRVVLDLALNPAGPGGAWRQSAPGR